ncbi:MAG: hypothetical protein U0R49_00565 [Fimbriimonadales bacterium]
MKISKTCLVIAGATVMGVVTAQAPRAEVGLLGVKLYDTGVNVVKRFGSPSEVVAVNFSQTNMGGGGGGGATGGPSRGPGVAGAPATGGRAGAEFVVPPLGMGQARRPVISGGEGGGTINPNQGGGNRAGGGGASGMQGTEDIQYVRWIYTRGSGSSVNFVLNKFNKVVQIEAIGIADSRVRTLKGVTLGCTLADVVKRYADPEGYDVGGDYFMMKFLGKYKCAFRFTRESAKTPYKITSIIVSAGRA